MNRYLLLAALTLGTGCAEAPAKRVWPTQVEDQGLLITLSTSRTEYLLGEPVMLELLLVSNTGQRILVPAEDYSGESVIGFYICRDGKRFKRVPRFKVHADDTWPLDLGSVCKYNIDILGDRYNSKDNHWYFPEPGAYCIRVFFPVESNASKREVCSNTVEVSVKEPTDPVDVKVWNELKNSEPAPRADPVAWKELKSWGLIDFLQTGHRTEQAQVTMVFDLYEAYPTSSYRPALRHALIKTRGRRLSKADSERVFKHFFLPVFSTDPQREGHQDLRLKRQVVNARGFPLMVQQALDSISTESGVPLSTDPRYAHLRVQFDGTDLKDHMHSIERNTDGIWVQRGDGYHLTRDE